MAEVTVTRKGPIFDGSAVRVVEQGTEAVVDAVTQAGLDLVHARLGQVLRHPTGKYQSRVVANRAQGSDAFVITDGGDVKGPWLEGTSGRNDRSRFKGYATFRRTREQLAGDAVEIGRPVMAEHIAKLNG